MTSRENSHATVSLALLRSPAFFRPSRGVRARVRRVASLKPAEVEAMWHLFAASYDGARRADFDHDLGEKLHVITLRAEDGHLAGFSTLLPLRPRPDACVVFSGDTIVEPAFWGQTALQRAFVWYLAAQRLRTGAPVYWFLITKGYRTYLLLTRNFEHFWPRHDSATPAAIGALLDELCQRKYGDAWDAKRGVLRVGGDACRLTGRLADVPSRLREDDDVRFFLEKNPRWAQGEELCCLGLADDAFVAKSTRIFL